MKEKKKKAKPSKGTFGYIAYRKKRALLNTIIMFMIAAAIFILGLCLNKFEKSNVFTIVAVLCVLPAAKMMVGYILFFPFKSVKREQYERIRELVRDEDKFYTDMVITSHEHVMNLAYMVIVGDKIFILTGREKEKPDIIREYLQTTTRRRGMDVTVGVYDDEKQFVKQIKSASRFSERDYDAEDMEAVLAERQELCEYLESLMA